MKKFPVDIITRPAIHAAGFHVRTTMANAMTDCSSLWEEKFSPFMASFPADPKFAGESYGISINFDMATSAFDYWVAMPLRPGAKLPDGMETIDLPAGLYAECRIASLADLPKTFEYLYGEWEKSQNAYAINYMAPCVELYANDYLQDGSLSICVPVTKK